MSPEDGRLGHSYMDDSGSGGFYQTGDFTEDQQPSQTVIHNMGGDPKVLSGQLAKLVSLDSFIKRNGKACPNDGPEFKANWTSSGQHPVKVGASFGLWKGQMNNNRYFSPPENTFMNFPNARSAFAMLILHGNLDEQIHSDNKTYTPVAKPNKTNDLATKISGTDVPQLGRPRKRPLERNVSCKEDGIDELDDWIQIQRPCLKMDLSRTNHVHGGRFSHLDPRLLTATTQGALGVQHPSKNWTGWSSCDQDFLGKDRPRQVLASLMPLTSDSYNMRIPVQLALSSGMC